REAGLGVLGLEDEVAALVEVDAVRRLVAGGGDDADRVLDLVAAAGGPGRIHAERGGELGDVDREIGALGGLRAAPAFGERGEGDGGSLCQGRVGHGVSSNDGWVDR